jgi:hypothetical protein
VYGVGLVYEFACVVCCVYECMRTVYVFVCAHIHLSTVYLSVMSWLCVLHVLYVPVAHMFSCTHVAVCGIHVHVWCTYMCCGMHVCMYVPNVYACLHGVSMSVCLVWHTCAHVCMYACGMGVVYCVCMHVHVMPHAVGSAQQGWLGSEAERSPVVL